MSAWSATGEEGPRGISCLVVEKDMAGVSFGAQERKLGWHSQPTAALILDGVRVPAENLVGGEGEGFRIAMMGLDGGRLNIGACSLGGAQRCLDEAIKYTKERRQFGRPIADFQNTQFTLADMDTELQAARALLYLAAAKVTAARPTGRASPRWPSASPPIPAAKWPTRRSSFTAATAI